MSGYLKRYFKPYDLFGQQYYLERLVPRAGFEPATLGLEVLCSIQLSYRGIKANREILMLTDVLTVYDSVY